MQQQNLSFFSCSSHGVLLPSSYAFWQWSLIMRSYSEDILIRNMHSQSVTNIQVGQEFVSWSNVGLTNIFVNWLTLTKISWSKSVLRDSHLTKMLVRLTFDQGTNSWPTFMLVTDCECRIQIATPKVYWINQNENFNWAWYFLSNRLSW